MTNRYHYNDLTDLTCEQLFFWVAVDKTLEQLGEKDIAAAFAVLAGQPIIPTRAKFRGATKGTSIASITARRLLNYDLKYRLPIITGATPLSLKIALTKNLGAFVGRAVPIVGWIILGYDVIQIIKNTVVAYNLIVRPEDRLPLI